MIPGECNQYTSINDQWLDQVVSILIYISSYLLIIQVIKIIVRYLCCTPQNPIANDHILSSAEFPTNYSVVDKVTQSYINTPQSERNDPEEKQWKRDRS